MAPQRNLTALRADMLGQDLGHLHYHESPANLHLEDLHTARGAQSPERLERVNSE